MNDSYFVTEIGEERFSDEISLVRETNSLKTSNFVIKFQKFCNWKYHIVTKCIQIMTIWDQLSNKWLCHKIRCSRIIYLSKRLKFSNKTSSIRKRQVTDFESNEFSYSPLWPAQHLLLADAIAFHDNQVSVIKSSISSYFKTIFYIISTNDI